MYELGEARRLDVLEVARVDQPPRRLGQVLQREHVVPRLRRHGRRSQELA